MVSFPRSARGLWSSSSASPSRGAAAGTQLMKKGSLVIVGTGIRTAGQLTTEAIAWIRRADKVLYTVSDMLAQNVIHRLNPGGAESMHHYYEKGKPRIETYRQM